MILSYRKKCLFGLGKVLLDALVSLLAQTIASVQVTLPNFVYVLSVIVVIFQVPQQPLLAGDSFFLQKTIPMDKELVENVR